MAESVGYGVIDTACTKTVAGIDWMNEFKAILSDEERAKVDKSERNSQSVYRFGDGAETLSIKTVDIPILIPGRKHAEYFEVDVVDNKLPLLISKPLMSKLGFIIDTERNEIKIQKLK